jgi:exonuclease III
MGISIDNYRAAIGHWHLSSLARKQKSPKTPLTPIKIKLLLGLLLSSYGVFIGMLLILQCGDVHPNPGPTTELKSLSICHVNVQSLYLRMGYHRRKIDEIHTLLINDQNIDIICLSETWLDNNITDAMVKIPGYSIRRKDRAANLAGGAGMYISDHIPNRRANEFEFPDIDLLWIELKIGHKKILVGACYRPPGQNLEEKELFISKLNDSLELVLQYKPESIFLLGDFNDSCRVWESDHKKSELGLRLYDLINAHDLHQMVINLTHIKDQAANILDLLITDYRIK